jgi:1-phosphofructokinase family hexose kinase
VIVCVAGNPSIDKLFEVDRILPGAIHRPLSFVQVPGGKGLNAARAAATLGASVVATGILAGHAGHWIAEALETEGLPGRFAWASWETRSSLSVADRRSTGLTEFYESGPSITIDEWDALERIVRELLQGAGWLSLSGSLPPGAQPDGYARLVRDAAVAAVRTSLDARGDALAKGIEAGPDVVKVNRQEAGELLGRSLPSLQDAAAAVRELRERCGGAGHMAVITLGEEGVVVAAPDGPVLVGRLDVRGPYPVGSGDAFLAGLVTVLDRTGTPWPVEEALRLGMGAAGANAEIPGAGRLDPDRANALAARARVQPLA